MARTRLSRRPRGLVWRILTLAACVGALAGLGIAPGLDAAAGTARAAQTEDFRALLAQAKAARDAGELEHAVTLLRRAHDLHPAPEILNNIGRVYEDLGRYQDATSTYRQVIDDPKADANLRALDAARVAALTPKLGRAWVRLTLTPSASRAWLGGRRAASGGAEIGLETGPQWIEGVTPDGATVWLLRRAFEAGRRTELALDTTAALQGELGATMTALTLSQASPPVRLEIDGYALRSDLGRATRVILPAGPHVVRAELDGGAVVAARRVLEAGQPTALSELGRDALARDAAQGAARRQGGQATSPGWGPYVLLGTGTATTATGIALALLADSDRGDVRSAQVDSRGVVTGLTLAQARKIEGDANDKGTAGAVLMGLGVAQLAGGLAWMIVDLTAGPETDTGLRVTWKHGGATVGVAGRF